MYNEYNQYYLAHHGIVGMKWGKRNGPPYPLNASTHNRIVKRGKKVGSGGDLRYKLTKAALKYGPALQGNFNPAHPVFKDVLAPAIAERAKNSLQKRSLNRNKNLKKMDNDIDDNNGNIKSKGQMLKDAEFTSKTIGGYHLDNKGRLIKNKKIVKELDNLSDYIDYKKEAIKDNKEIKQYLDKKINKLEKKAGDINDAKETAADYMALASSAGPLLRILKKNKNKSVGKMPKGALKALAVLNPAMARSLPDAIVNAKASKSSFSAMKEAIKKNTKNGRIDMTDDNFWNLYEDYFTALDENMRKNGLY